MLNINIVLFAKKVANFYCFTQTLIFSKQESYFYLHYTIKPFSNTDRLFTHVGEYSELWHFKTIPA